MVWPAVIAAGATLAASALSSSSGASSGWGKQVYADQKAREDTRFQRSVADAKAAGLHPLFALGTAGSYGGGAGGWVGGGGTPSGTAMGAGIARAGEQIATGMRTAKAGERTEKLDAAGAQIHALRVTKMGKEIQLDDAELAKRASDLAMAQQSLGMWGDGGTGMSTGDLSSKTYPYGTKAGPPLNMRPLTASARESMPMMIEQVGPKGRRMIMNPALGDEVAQVYNTVDPWVQYGESFYNKRRWKKTDRYRRRTKPRRQFKRNF